MQYFNHWASLLSEFSHQENFSALYVHDTIIHHVTENVNGIENIILIYQKYIDFLILMSYYNNQQK